ncbi:glutamine synthetase family protein [Sphaerisporangium viridialbum]|uniref:glutamine synthetase family protein n=1 Tax=Sphaerisporangium viridialbum TaxID=46189 RepID=UPI003C778D5F
MFSPQDVAEAHARLRDAGTRLVVMTVVDNAGVTRVKVIPLRRFESAATGGVGMSTLWAVAGSDDQFAAVPPYDSPSGDLRLFPDITAARPLPSSPGYAWVPAIQYEQSLEISAGCQRSVLRSVVENARSMGFEFRTVFESEMTLLNRDGAPAHSGPAHSARALLPLEDFALALVEALDGAGIDVEQVHPEYSPGQFEVAIAPRDPLAAADEVVLLRYIARQVAHRHALDVSFAPVVNPGAAGNGAHMHVSVWRDGENLMQDDGTTEPGMRADGAAFTAGILEELPRLLAVLAPTAASYERLKPNHWSGAFACWGVENREAALRFIPGTVSVRRTAANLEVKTVDGAANPYLATALLLASGMRGIERRLELPAPVQSDPAGLSEVERDKHRVTRLPEDLARATELFAGSELARSVLGGTLHGALVAVRERAARSAATRDVHELAIEDRFRY